MFFLLLLFWIALNGKITVEILIIGLVASVFIFWLMCKFFEYSPKGEILIIKNFFRSIIYIFVLLWEILKANAGVLKIVYSRKIDIEPQIVFFDVPIKSEFLRIILANSITLTPGTITVNVEDNHFCVHALDYTMAEDIENIIFVKLLMKMEEND